MTKELEAALKEAIEAVLARPEYRTEGYPNGLEIQGIITGVIQHKDAPETANGFKIKLGIIDGWWSHLRPK